MKTLSPFPRTVFALWLASLCGIGAAFGQSSNPYSVRAWTNIGKADGVEFKSNVTPLGVNVASEGCRTGDFDGDGKADLVRVFPNGSLAIVIHPGGSSGFESKWISKTQLTNNRNGNTFPWIGSYPQFPTVLVGDINGDGKDDLVDVTGFYASRKDKGRTARVGIYFSTGGGFQEAVNQQLPAAHWDMQRWLMGDVNGDGRDDLILIYAGPEEFATVWVHLSTGSGFRDDYIFQRLVGAFWDEQKWMMGDLNGDGKDDLVFVYAGPEAIATVWAHLSTGSGFDGDYIFQRLAGSFWDEQKWMMGDLNGDGKDDIVFVYGGGAAGESTVWAHLSTGAGFRDDYAFQRLAGEFRNGQQWMMGDVDGDSRADVVCVDAPLVPPRASKVPPRRKPKSLTTTIHLQKVVPFTGPITFTGRFPVLPGTTVKGTIEKVEVVYSSGCQVTFFKEGKPSVALRDVPATITGPRTPLSSDQLNALFGSSTPQYMEFNALIGRLDGTIIENPYIFVNITWRPDR